MDNRELILITGGARSGKSRFALGLASSKKEKIFIATATALDQEMRDRIELHRRERDVDWKTIEEPIEISDVLRKSSGAVVLDCLTLWISNLMYQQRTDDEILQSIDTLCETVKNRKEFTALVTNEVGFGIVPENQDARRFRDLSGVTNQRIASEADSVILMVSGLPIYIKGRKYADPPD